jgi:signal transduction histidine kinase
MLNQPIGNHLTSLFDPQSNSPIHLRRALGLMEAILIGIELLLGFINGAYQFSTLVTTQTLGFFLAFGMLCCIIPVNRSLWERRLYVFMNMLLVVGTAITNVAIDLLLFWTIVKICFLLELKEVIVTVILTGIAYTLGTAWGLPNLYEMVNERGIDFFLTPQNLILGSLSYYTGGSIFSILLSLMILTERKSRRRVEVLAQEVEALSANLERARIARDIHDSLGHILTTLGIQLEVAQKLRQHQPEQASYALDTAKLLADQCLEEVRHTVQMIRKTDFDFDQAILTLLEQIKQTKSLTVISQIHLPQLPLRVRHQLYCIIQEGLTNIQKHARASQIIFKADITSGYIYIKLVDNGQGFNVRQVSDGFGLQSMRERVELLGGKLIIKSVLGRGTQLEIIVPQ